MSDQPASGPLEAVWRKLSACVSERWGDRAVTFIAGVLLAVGIGWAVWSGWPRSEADPVESQAVDQPAAGATAAEPVAAKEPAATVPPERPDTDGPNGRAPTSFDDDDEPAARCLDRETTASEVYAVLEEARDAKKAYKDLFGGRAVCDTWWSGTVSGLPRHAGALWSFRLDFDDAGGIYAIVISEQDLSRLRGGDQVEVAGRLADDGFTLGLLALVDAQVRLATGHSYPSRG